MVQATVWYVDVAEANEEKDRKTASPAQRQVRSQSLEDDAAAY